MHPCSALPLLIAVAWAAPNKRPADVGQLDEIARELDQNELLEKPFVRFTNVAESGKVVAGHQLQLSCEAIGIPPPAISWTLNGAPIVQGLHDNDRNLVEKVQNMGLTTIQNGVTISRLSLPCIDEKHEGVFACVADNGFTQIVSKAVVEVSQGVEPARCDKAKKDESAAQIYMWTDGRFEQTGAAAQLYCRAKGSPTPVISWLDVEHNPITADQTFEPLPNGDLLIKSAGWDQIGVYTCIAKNAHGEDKAEIFFYPTEKEDVAAKVS
uniref:Ig-like domain-containing protein n=1 Tax=Plectus sambesii TaxID=2011161 RepID=A0A914XIC6_9BILA